MADKAITELVEASQVTATDLFVLQQDNTAKKLSGQTLINYLLKMIDGHGGVRSWEKVASVGLVDTYRFTMADEIAFEYTVSNGRAIDSITPTTADGLTRTYTIAFNDGSSESFTVTDGRGILSFGKTSTSGLVDTYTVIYNDGTSDTFTVKNGEKGDKGDNAHVHFKFASEKPVDASSSFGDLPDNWMGIYSGHLEEAPEDYSLYTWFKVKGEKGDTGDPATLVSALTTYQLGDSGNVIPSGIWATTIPVVPQGKYLWTRQVIQFNTGDPVTTYSVARFGIDGAGSVSSVAGISPDENGNVPLTASDVKALPLAGGDMEGPVNMNGQTLSGLNAPTEEDEAATKGYVDENGGDLVVDLEGAGAGDPNGINADTLGGYPADDYVRAKVANNFTTTEEGFVADARALKILYDAVKAWSDVVTVATYEYGTLFARKNEMLKLAMVVWNGNTISPPNNTTIESKLPDGYVTLSGFSVPVRNGSVLNVTESGMCRLILTGMTWSNAFAMYAIK